MELIYQTQVNDSHEFEVSSQAIEALDAIAIDANTYHVIHNNASVTVKVLATDFLTKQYRISINGNNYNVSIDDALGKLIKKMGFELSSTKHVNTITAPMPGLILDISVEVGQEVAEDDALLILEAMKMENVLTSPRSGVIKSISTTKGDAVDKGALLIEFE